MHVRVEHTFTNVDVERFVEVYYSEAFNRAVAPLASLSVRELKECTELEDGRVRRRVRMVPEVKLPGPIKHLLRGSPVHYSEVSTYDPRSHEARYEIESRAGDLVRVWGTIRFEPHDEGGVKRIIDGQVVVNVPGLGGLIERLITKELKSRYNAIQAFTQRYLDDNAPPAVDPR